MLLVAMVIIINYLQSADSLCFPSLNILQKLNEGMEVCKECGKIYAKMQGTPQDLYIFNI